MHIEADNCSNQTSFKEAGEKDLLSMRALVGGAYVRALQIPRQCCRLRLAQARSTSAQATATAGRPAESPPPSSYT